MFLMQGVGAFSSQMSNYLFKWKVGEVAGASNLPPGKHDELEESQACQ